MARKSMIEPTLPRTSESEGGVLDRIIARDRTQSGRGTPPRPEESSDALNETDVTTLQRTPEETNDAPNVLTNDELSIHGDQTASVQHSSIRNGELEAGQAASKPGAAKPKASVTASAVDERQLLALQRAEQDEIAVVTVRAPHKLNGYVDRYVERVNRVNPRRRYRKQDAVAEMFAWFYASHPLPPAPDEEDL